MMALDKVSMAISLAMVMAVAMMGFRVEATVLLDHIIGGRLGWTFPPNTTYYKDWAVNRTFVVGDKLVFMYRSGMENVMEVSKEDFDACTEEKIIDWQYQGPTVIVLKNPGPHYYYSAVGTHCEHGQKLFINVSATAIPDPARDGLPPLAAPSSANSLSYHISFFLGLISMLLLIATLRGE